MRQIDSSNIRPKQSTNDIVVLKTYAKWGKPVFDGAMSFIVNSFENQNGIKNISIITTPNKSDKRIEEKIKEYDIGDYDQILDYIRGTIVFKNLEDLFDFINFSKNFDFSNLGLTDVDNKHLRILKYGVNSLSLDKQSLTDNDIQKYPFLHEKTKLRKSEYMDYKMYMKIPTKSSKTIKGQYIIAEIICILEDFYNFYSTTHYLYELIRVDIDIQKLIKIDLMHLKKFIEYMVYHIHRHNVIEEYNKNSTHKMKLVEINPAREEDKNKFFNSLPELSKQDIIKIIRNSVYDKAANNFDSHAMLQIKELLDNSFNRR